jgi:hypothetical protein
MKTHVRGVFVGVALALAVLCLSRPGAAGGGKDTGWKEFLDPKDAKELTDRARKTALGALAGNPDEDAIKKAQANLLTIAAYARSIKGGAADRRGATYQSALELARRLGQKGKLAGVRMSLEKNFFVFDKGDFNGDLTKLGVDNAALMEHYKTVGKGGDGIHASLQSNIKLKGTQNGIEEKIRTLITKKLPQATLEKESEELALLALRVAAVGELVHEFPPKKTAKANPAEWRDYAVAMRDAGIELAAAARKKDAEAVFKASTKLNGSCSQCHATFRLVK